MRARVERVESVLLTSLHMKTFVFGGAEVAHKLFQKFGGNEEEWDGFGEKFPEISR